MDKENLEPSDKMGEAQLDGPIYEEVDKQIPKQTLPQAEEPIHDHQSIGLDERVPTPGTADQADPTKGNHDDVPVEKTQMLGELRQTKS